MSEDGERGSENHVLVGERRPREAVLPSAAPQLCDPFQSPQVTVLCAYPSPEAQAAGSLRDDLLVTVEGRHPRGLDTAGRAAAGLGPQGPRDESRLCRL